MIHGNKELGYNYKNNETNIRKYIIYIFITLIIIICGPLMEVLVLLSNAV